MLTIIQVIHWLFKEKIAEDKKHDWVLNVPMAVLKVIKHNHVSQKITIEAANPTTTTAAVPGNRKHPDDIKREMEGNGPHGDFELANVGLTLAEARQVTVAKFGNRKKCDTCMFFPRNTGETCTVVKDKVCANCLRIYGRPFCSWTPNIPAVYVPGATALGNSFDQLESQGDTENATRRTALHGLKGWAGTDTLSADPVRVALDDGEEIEGMLDTELDAAEVEDGEWLGP
jgi:hypothetical protein